MDATVADAALASTIGVEIAMNGSIGMRYPEKYVSYQNNGAAAAVAVDIVPQIANHL